MNVEKFIFDLDFSCSIFSKTPNNEGIIKAISSLWENHDPNVVEPYIDQIEANRWNELLSLNKDDQTYRSRLSVALFASDIIDKIDFLTCMIIFNSLDQNDHHLVIEKAQTFGEFCERYSNNLEFCSAILIPPKEQKMDQNTEQKMEHIFIKMSSFFLKNTCKPLFFNQSFFEDGTGTKILTDEVKGFWQKNQLEVENVVKSIKNAQWQSLLDGNKLELKQHGIASITAFAANLIASAELTTALVFLNTAYYASSFELVHQNYTSDVPRNLAFSVKFELDNDDFSQERNELFYLCDITNSFKKTKHLEVWALPYYEKGVAGQNHTFQPIYGATQSRLKILERLQYNQHDVALTLPGEVATVHNLQNIGPLFFLHDNFHKKYRIVNQSHTLYKLAETIEKYRQEKQQSDCLLIYDHGLPLPLPKKNASNLELKDFCLSSLSGLIIDGFLVGFGSDSDLKSLFYQAIDQHVAAAQETAAKATDRAAFDLFLSDETEYHRLLNASLLLSQVGLGFVKHLKVRDSCSQTLFHHLWD